LLINNFMRCCLAKNGARPFGAQSFFKGWWASDWPSAGAREGPCPALGTKLALAILFAWHPTVVGPQITLRAAFAAGVFSARSLDGPRGLDDARNLECDLERRPGGGGLGLRTTCLFGLPSGVTGLAFKSIFTGGARALGRANGLVGSFNPALLAALVVARFCALFGATLGRVPPMGTASTGSGAALVRCCTCSAWATRSWRPSCLAIACTLDACERSSRLRFWSSCHGGFWGWPTVIELLAEAGARLAVSAAAMPQILLELDRGVPCFADRDRSLPQVGSYRQCTGTHR